MDLKIKESFLEQARNLHRENPVVDAHLDLAGEILLRNQAGESNIIRKYYLEHFRSAGINLVVSSVYVESSNLKRGYENALQQISALKKDIADLSEVRLIQGRQDIASLQADNKIGILLYMEGLDCIEGKVERLSELADLGVRGASLTWSRPNALATGCCKASEHRQVSGGLTELGKQVVKRMEELSLFLDISHLNDEGFADICKIASKGFVATHSCSRQIYDSYRNLTNEQMRELAKRGGIIGINGYKYIAGSMEGNHLEMLCRHIEHMVERIGAAHVGYGFDLCDSYDQARAALLGKRFSDRNDCLLHHGQIPLLTAALLQRGMPEEAVKRVVGQNFWSFFEGYLPEATS